MRIINERLEAIIAKATIAAAAGNAAAIDAIRAAYNQGFDDGIDHVARTARSERSARVAAPSATVASVPVATRENPFNSQPIPRRAPYGLCRRAIDEALNVSGEAGIDLEIVSETGFRMEGGRKLASSSVRSTLIEMQNAGQVERRGGRWFRASRPEKETAGHAHEANPAALIPHSQGVPNGTALTDH